MAPLGFVPSYTDFMPQNAMSTVFPIYLTVVEILETAAPEGIQKENNGRKEWKELHCGAKTSDPLKKQLQRLWRSLLCLWRVTILSLRDV